MTLKLPPPHWHGRLSLEDVMARRRSIRKLASGPLTWDEIGQLLWSAYGITEPKEGLRTTPSAYALYPLEIYVLTHEGVYHYRPRTHEVVQTSRRDIRAKLRKAALDQECMDAPCVMLLTAVYQRVTKNHRDTGKIWVDFEVGHCAQNVLLQAVALGLAALPVAAFAPKRVRELVKLPERQIPLYMIPIGRAQ